MAVTAYFTLFVRRVLTSHELDYRKSICPASALQICRSEKVTTFRLYCAIIYQSNHTFKNNMESRQIVGLRQSVAKKNSLEWTFWTQTDRPIFMKKGKGK